MDVTKKVEPTGVDRGASEIEGSKRGANGKGTRRKKLSRGVGLQGPTGIWGAGRGWQDSNCKTGGGGRQGGRLFGRAVQDRNEGVKLGVKCCADQS